MQSNDAVKNKSNRRTLMILLLVFILPAIVSFTLYITKWRPSTTVNYGELILPVHPVADRELQSIDGQKVKLSELFGKWSMVFLGSSSCPEQCMSQLFFMRQTHLSQGKNYKRMQRLFFLTDAASIAELKAKLNDYPDMKVLSGDQFAMSGLLRDFDADVQSIKQQNYIYLMDPQGNIMMRYKLGADPAGTRKDIERLLKYSND